MTNLARAFEISTVVAILLSVSLLAVVVSGAAAGSSAASAGSSTAAGDQVAAKPAAPPPSPGARQAAPTAEEARAFIEGAEKRLLEFTIKADRAGWVQSNFITVDTERLAAEAREAQIAANTEYALAAVRFDGLTLPPDVARKIKLLKLSLELPAPNNPAERSELTEIVSSLESTYGKGRYCTPGAAGAAGMGGAQAADGDCLDLNAITRILAESRDPQRLLEVWRGWHAISPPMRAPYQRFVELANKGARELGFPDLGALWRAGYDMPPDAYAAEVERLWQQVAPLYRSLHAHVRASLAKKYGPQAVPEDGPIPAHLLGNMWAQSWSNIFPLVAPPEVDPGFDLTEILRARKFDPREMVRYGERFFTSLGFDPLPPTFWERSLFTKPVDHDVVCHASAWDIDAEEDLRIKMCIEINDEDFSTIHHELGHNFYQRAYRRQPPLFRAGANGAFHEAIGDTIALSITPDYLGRVGLLDKPPATAGDLGLLMKMALDKVAFLPFGLLVDQWRWKVFSGEVRPEGYNKAWWDLRLKYQGVAPPVARSESDFDPGAKYHVPANVSYTRYFMAHILQFQFHRALCREAGFKGPLHQCSIYGNEAAGKKLRAMLEMGQSRPWPDALEALTGEKRMDATAILDYFAPLKSWLDAQNKGRKPGWREPSAGGS
jgi:peptidyl-dipeptidase A